MLGKEYSKLLADESRVEGNKVCVRGSNAALAAAIAEIKLGTFPLPSPATRRVPSFKGNWLPMPDSNEQILCE